MSFVKNLFGGGSAPQVQFTPQGFSTPTGFSVSGGGNVAESPTLSGNIGNLQNTFKSGAAAFGNLASTVAPGFSNFRRVGLEDITNTFNQNKANLQDTLGQRRILGSSFANSQFSQAYADEAQAKANFEAQSYLAELGASSQLIQQQYTYATQSFSTAINQSNIEAATAATLTSNVNNAMASVAETNAKLQMAQQELNQNVLGGFGSFLGTLGTARTAGGGSVFGNLFS